MNYQYKYLKYKSKYLEKKYGRKFRYKIDNDNDNDLDFKQKYLKYKSKYLDIKYGGETTIEARDRKQAEGFKAAKILAAKQLEDEKIAAAKKLKDIENLDKKKKILLGKLKKIIINTPYKLKLINCTKGQEEYKKGFFGGKTNEVYCPQRYYYSNYINSLIKIELDNHYKNISDNENRIINKILDAALTEAIRSDQNKPQYINDINKLKTYIIERI